MRILFVTQWYVPEPVRYIAELAEGMAAKGHGVTVLTAFPNWPDGRVYEGYRQKLLFTEEIGGVQVRRTPLYPDHSNSSIARALNTLSFSLSATTVATAVLERHDAILMLSPPLSVFLPALCLSRKWRAPMLLNIQDMWPEALAAAGFVRSGFLLRAIEATCQLVYRRASRIVVISNGFKRNLVAKGVPAEKVEVISNGVDTEKFAPRPRDESLASSLGLQGKFNVIYAGSMGPSQDLINVVEAANRLRQDERIQIVLVGDGNEIPRLKQRCAQLGLPNVKFLGRYPEEEIGQILNLADVLMVHLKDDPLFEITVCHKNFVYMAMGKPILSVVGGDAAELVKRTGAGLACPPGSAEMLAAKLTEISRLPPDQLEAMGRRGRAAACNQFSKQIQVENYLGVMDRVLQER